MGDRTYTSIEFSGEISEQQATELIALLKNQGCCSNVTDNVPTIEGLKEYAHDSFYDHECNYGTMEEIESWCPLNRVSYLKTWAQGGDYGPGIELYDHTTSEIEQVAALENSPAISLSDLIKLRDAGEIDKEIDRLKKLENFSKIYSPLKVFELKDWPDDLCKFMAERALDGDDS